MLAVLLRQKISKKCSFCKRLPKSASTIKESLAGGRHATLHPNNSYLTSAEGEIEHISTDSSSGIKCKRMAAYPFIHE